MRVDAVKAYISETRLMASTLYQSIFEKGEARGEARGKREERADTIIRLLIRRVGPLDPAMATRIQAEQSLDTLDVWLNEALDLPDTASAHRLIERIGKAAQS
jgi:predicted transposase YdaD